MQNVLRKALRRQRLRGARHHRELNLPHPGARSNQSLESDDAYIESAVAQVTDLLGLCELGVEPDILDFGCGQGRLANGLIVTKARIGAYHGIDTDGAAISWCQRWISDDHPDFRFTHVPARNGRYNPRATGRQPLPGSNGSYDLVFLNSVFSHMLSDDVAFYASEFARVLRPGGSMYATAFIEDGVPDEEENPDGYLPEMGPSQGALHRVRFDRPHFESLIQDSGLSIVEIRHRAIERTGQSVVVARLQEPG